LQYEQGPTNGIAFKVTGAGFVTSPNDYQDCKASVLSFDTNYILHVPSIDYNNNLYWADFEYVPTTDGQIWFKLTEGAN